jgi:GT2 family glycosyltransferase
MNSVNICFLILNYNSYKDTISFVQHILNQEKIIQLLPIMIVDNCSSDHSFEILLQEFHDNQNIEVIQTQKNGGYGYGNNWGIKYLQQTYNPEFIIISNPDIIADVAIIPEMLKAFQVDKKIAAVSVQMVNSNNKPHLSFIHHVGKTINKILPSKLSKFRILQESTRYYQKEYLKQNRIKLFIFDCFTLIGIIEK